MGLIALALCDEVFAEVAEPAPEPASFVDSAGMHVSTHVYNRGGPHGFDNNGKAVFELDDDGAAVGNRSTGHLQGGWGIGLAGSIGGLAGSRRQEKHCGDRC